jgi:hypothetical protein
MATASTVDIFIDIRSRLDQLNRVTEEMSRLKKEASGFFNSLTLGLGIDFAGRITAGIGQLTGSFKGAVEDGVKFNATVEGAQLGIAAVLKQFDRANRFSTFDDALKASAEAIELLKKKAIESPASFESLVQAFQATAGAATSAGIPLKKQIDLLVNLSQALAGLGIRNEQIVQETRALLTGNITEDAQAAKILGITSAQVTQAKESGQLFEFLSGKISSFAEAGKRGAETYNTALSNLGDATQQAEAEITKPIFEELKKSFLDLTKVVSSQDFKDSFKPLARDIADFVQASTSATKTVLEYSGTLIALAKSVATLSLAFTAMKAVQGAGSLVQNVGQWIALKTATDAAAVATARETVATQANTSAKVQNSLAVVAGIRERLKSAEIAASVGTVEKISSSIGGAATSTASFGSRLASALGTMNLVLIAAGLISTAVNLWVGKIEASNEVLNSLNERFNEQIRSVSDQIKGLESISQKESLRNDLIKSRNNLETESLSKKGDELVAYQLQIKWIDLTLQRLEQMGEAQIKINAAKAADLRAREKQAQLDAQEAAQFEPAAKKARVTEKQIAFDALPSDADRVKVLKEERQKIFAQAGKDSQTRIGSTLELRDQFLVEDTKAVSGGSDAVKAKAKRRAEDLQSVFEIEKQISELETKQAKDAEDSLKKERERKSLLSEIAALEKEISGDKKGADSLRLDAVREKSFNQFKDNGLTDAQANQGADLERQKQARGFAKQRADEETQRIREDLQKKADQAADNAVTFRAKGQIDRAQAEEQYQQILIETLRLMEREKISLEEAREKATAFVADKSSLANAERERILKENRAQNRIGEVQSARSSIESNRALTPETKNRLILQSLSEEQKALLETIKLWEERRTQIEGNAPEAVLAREELSTKINQSRGRVSDIQTQKTSLTDQGQFTDGLLSRFQNLGTIAAQTGQLISDTMGRAVDGVSGSIAAAIVRGEDWRESMQNVALSIIESLIQMGIQMILMNTLGRTLQAASQAQAVTTGPAIAAAYAPAAAASSVASFGGAATAGVIAATIAIAAIIALLAGGFAQGGLISGTPSKQDNRLAMVATGEYVARSAAVRYYGPETFEALNQMRLPKDFLGNLKVPVSARPAVAFAQGGLVTPLQAVQSDKKESSNEVRIAFTNSRQDTRDFIRGEGRGMIVDIASRQTSEIL